MPELVIQAGHSADVVCFAPNGKWLASGSDDQTVKLWDAASGHLLRTFGGHSHWVTSISFSPDGKQIASGSWDNTVKLWEITSGKLLRTLEHNGTVFSVSFSPDGKKIVTGSRDETASVAKVWEVASGRLLRVMAGFSSDITSISFSPDGQKIATAAHDFELWNIASGQRIHTFNDSSGVDAVSFSPDGRTIASGGWDNTVKLWDAASGRLLKTIAGYYSAIISVCFSPDGQFIAAGGFNHSITLSDVASGQRLPAFKERIVPEVKSISFSPDSKTVAAVDDGIIKLWDVSSGQLLRALRWIDFTNSAHFSSDGQKIAFASRKGITLWDGQTFRKLAESENSYLANFSPDGKIFASTGDYNTIKIWDTFSAQHTHTLKGHSAHITAFSFLPDGQGMVSGSYDNTIKLWDAVSGQRLKTFKGHSAEINFIVFSPDGQKMASAGKDSTVKLWDVVSGRLISTFKHSANIESISFSPDGKKLLSGDWDSKVRLWDTISSQLIRSFARKDSFAVSSRGFSPDGQNIILIDDGAIKLWEVAAGQLRILESFNETDYDGPVVFSPDGQKIALESWNNSIKLWNLASGQLLHTLEGHASNVNFVSFSPDGKIIATASDDNTIKLWEVDSGRLIRTLEGSSSGAKSVRFSSDGRKIISKHGDTSIKFWEAQAGVLLASVIALEENSWMAFTPEGFFDGTRNAWQLVPFRFPSEPLKLYEPEQFFNQFYQPDLLAEVLREAKPMREVLAAQGDRRADLDISTYRNSNLPEIRIFPPEISSERDTLWGRSERIITVEIEAKDTGAGLRDLRVFHNSSLIHFAHGDLQANAAAKTLRLLIPVKLVAGENHFSAYCFNRDNLKSKEASVNVVGDEDFLGRKGNVYVVAIGINEYADAMYNLKYAVPDARIFADTLCRRMRALGNYANIIPVLLLNENAIKPNILAALALLSGEPQPLSGGASRSLYSLQIAEPEDIVIIYFAGHGAAKDDRYYLIPHDIGAAGNHDALLARSISDQELESGFEKIIARQIVLIIDACQSGQALEAEEKRRGPMNSRGLAQLAYEKGMQILAAAQSQQAALEFDKLGHGLLTYVLVQEGLAKMQADYMPANGEITSQEWLDYAVQRVPVETQAAVERFMRNLTPEGAKRNQIINGQLPRAYYRREAETQPLVLWKK